MKFHCILVSLALTSRQWENAQAFQLPVRSSIFSSSSTALLVKSRKARRMDKVEKQSRGRSQQFYEAIEEARGEKKENKPEDEEQEGSSPPQNDDEARRAARMEEAERRMAQRPEVSTMLVDEETGFEVIAQGQSVMDVVTRKAVKLSDLGPEYRLAQMFPGVPPDIREKYRFDWRTVEVDQMVDQLRDACFIKLADGSRGVPPHPSVTNKALDFVLANRDLLGERMKDVLGRITMQAASEGRDEDMEKMNKLWINFLTIENHLSAPFRQIIQDAEGRVGPNFGNLELTKFCKGDLYERIGNYIVLKGMVAQFEKKVVDANYIENTKQTDANYIQVLTRGDPRRYQPDPPILFTLRECTQVCAMAQKMCQLFVETEELYKDFPPEIVFLEDALKVKGGTALRKYMIEEFCPSRGITPEGLREGMRRFHQQLSNMQRDPYFDLTKKVGDLCKAMAVGTDDERDPYSVYSVSIKPGQPGFFQTYTFDFTKQSVVRFLDNQYPSAGSVEIFSNKDSDSEESVSTLDVCTH